MGCPHCASADTSERRERTALGYRRFRCRTCKREFNERTGTRFNHRQYPTDVVCLVVLWRVRYKLSLRDLPEMLLERDMIFTMRTSKYLNNVIEQDHRVVKRITRPMLGFKSFWAARCTLAGIEVMHAIRKGQ